MAETASSPVSVEGLLRDARRRLQAAGVAEPDLDARLLLREALGLEAAGLVLRAREPVSEPVLSRLDSMVARRLAGEPVHRIIGRRAFHQHDFALSPDTLEPRPDTEALVDLAAILIAQTIRDTGRCTLIDVGTGTGAIAVSLLALFPQATAVATDIAPGALRIARDNAAAAGVGERFLPVLADFLQPFRGPLDMVVSNPPYIASGDVDRLPREVREHDPRRALDGGPDGLDAYRALTQDAFQLLRLGGHLIVEIGRGQEDEVTGLAERNGLRFLRAVRDLGGIVRALAFARR